MFSYKYKMHKMFFKVSGEKCEVSLLCVSDQMCPLQWNSDVSKCMF